MSLYTKLLEIQKSIAGLTKDATGNNGAYVSGNKILAPVRAQMDSLGILLIPEVEEADFTRQDYNTPKGTKSEMFCALKIKFTWVDAETKETLVCHWASSGLNGWDKGYGSALTYGERYFLLKFFHIPTDRDDVDFPKTPEQEMSDQQAIDYINSISSVDDLNAAWNQYEPFWKGNKDIIKAFNNRKKALTNGAT